MDTTNLVPVNIGACQCPEQPHAEGDVVYLRPRLDLRGGFRVKRRLIDLNRAAQISDMQIAFRNGEATVHQLANRFSLAPSEVQAIIDGKGDTAELMKVERVDLEINLAEVYLDEGISAWNLVDEEGKERPITSQTLREYLFSDYGRIEAVADKADDLYRPAVLDPLFQRALNSLPATPTAESTSQMNGHGSKPKKPSKRSSTSGTRTASTAETT